ncbi:MAG: hypothetical protein RLZZ142_1950, partial [Verrucomicrobiota bacterium]
MARENFTVFAPRQDHAAVSALSEILASGKKETVSVANTIDEMLNADSEVLLMVLDDGDRFALSQEALAELKKKKIIGIGYRSAGLFEALGLDINGGLCMRNPDDLKPEILPQKNPLMPDFCTDSVPAYELVDRTKEPKRQLRDYNFALHLPPKSPLISFVDVIARWQAYPNH